MKALGIVRKVDELGRFSIPSELRKIRGMSAKEPLEISVRDGNLVLKKYEPTCYFCDGTENIFWYKNKPVCRECIDNLKERSEN